MVILQFIKRQIDANLDYERQLKALSTTMKLEHPRGRFKVFTEELQVLHFRQISNELAIAVCGKQPRLLVRRNVLKKRVDYVKAEIAKAKQQCW